MITKASPVVVELLFIPLLDVYSIPSRSQLIDWAEALAFILLLEATRICKNLMQYI